MSLTDSETYCVKEPIDCVVTDLFVENVTWELEL